MQQILNAVTPGDLVIVLQLIILEGLLSFDNALALAALVSRRLTDEADRKKALTWGIWGAFVSHDHCLRWCLAHASRMD